MLGNKTKNNSIFSGFILLKDENWNIEQIKKYFVDDWEVEITNEDSTEDTIVFDAEKMTVGLTLVKNQVPNGEAEKNAATNYMWESAVEVTKTHQAFILVAILGKDEPVLDAGKLYVKICSSLLRQSNAIGIYTAGTVFEPSFYIDSAKMIKDDKLPIPNWIYIGIYQSKDGISAYTYGLRNFCKEELEVIDSKNDANELYYFLFDICYYILENNVLLKDGETIGFTEEQKLGIIESKGVAISGNTLKINF